MTAIALAAAERLRRQESVLEALSVEESALVL